MESTIIPQPQSSLGFFGIIRESIKTTSRNGKILVTILLFVFLSFSQLDFAQEDILAPVINDVVWQLKQPNMVRDISYRFDQITYAGAFNDLREYLLVKLLIMLISSIIMLFFLVATVSYSSEAYTAKISGPKDIFLKIKKGWKKPIVTSFYMILLTLSIALFYTLSIGITSILVVNSWAVWFIGDITLSIPVCCFYIAALWMVSLIVSVLEDGSTGLKAIGRASELMKGKRQQASLIN
ncbi:hypothetical protein HanPI659440_Chr03g0100871 [Helianthus annuus]|uniref:Uncharacterized protein n=1 Tax=Helianthus annuus TaxID=4232 RepID=A0A251V6T6_HELAN|nr:hypothetical protein HanXRQr2_Chr03g0094841 [Helianthus annuus]KAJ0591955.1 hypothetical protein HanHA300_Chr03g0079271 [Helianthus annuus]KAJ0599329.1 hypothetical protein HanIR_Chr03g0103621 [Helianthus annuus]KAJ0606926.1 hypothetical protein HanHA89_Chr03g0090621 [Helianthus annuus]KAJ0766992.1 hypothetical protein HanLR1_Chr03g0083941 [Helianthus annuus]